MGVAILGIGTAVPHQSIEQPEVAEIAKTLCCLTDEQAALLPALYRRARVQKRGSVLLHKSNGEAPRQSFFPPAVGVADHGPTTEQRMRRYEAEAPRLATEAARQALAESRLPASHLTHLITVSCTGFVAPGVDLTLMGVLGLPRSIARTHVGFMGCHGALNALRLACAFISANPEARVLVCSVELCSLHFHYGWNPEKMVVNALFADGAAALVAAPTVRAPTDAWRVAATGSFVFPDSAKAMTWRIGDHGFEMALSARVPQLIAAHLRPWLDEWLADYGVTVPEIPSWAVHPGGPRLLSTIAACLKVPDRVMAPSREVLGTCGNMSSATLLFILERLYRESAPRPCVALGFGPGLAVEAALLT